MAEFLKLAGNHKGSIDAEMSVISNRYPGCIPHDQEACEPT